MFSSFCPLSVCDFPKAQFLVILTCSYGNRAGRPALKASVTDKRLKRKQEQELQSTLSDMLGSWTWCRAQTLRVLNSNVLLSDTHFIFCTFNYKIILMKNSATPKYRHSVLSLSQACFLQKATISNCEVILLAFLLLGIYNHLSIERWGSPCLLLEKNGTKMRILKDYHFSMWRIDWRETGRNRLTSSDTFLKSFIYFYWIVKITEREGETKTDSVCCSLTRWLHWLELHWLSVSHMDATA